MHKMFSSRMEVTYCAFGFGTIIRLWKEEMSYGGGTWYMDSTLEELKIMCAFGVFPFA